MWEGGWSVAMSGLHVLRRMECCHVRFTCGREDGVLPCQVYMWEGGWSVAMSGLHVVRRMECCHVRFTCGREDEVLPCQVCMWEGGWSVAMSGLHVVGRMEGGIVLPPSECLPCRSANTLHSGHSANILSRWLHIFDSTLLCL